MWLCLTAAAGWKWWASASRYPPHGVIALCEILGLEVSPLCHLCHFSVICILVAVGLSQHPASILSCPPSPSWSPGKNHLLSWLSVDFFFFNTNFPLFQGNLQSGLVCAWFGERLVLCFMLPEERLSTCFSFWFDSLPLCRGVRGYSCCCQLQMGTPLFKKLHVNPLVGEKTAERKSQTKQKKLKPLLTGFFFCFVCFFSVSHSEIPRVCWGLGLTVLGGFLKEVLVPGLLSFLVSFWRICIACQA